MLLSAQHLCARTGAARPRRTVVVAAAASRRETLSTLALAPVLLQLAGAGYAAEAASAEEGGDREPPSALETPSALPEESDASRPSSLTTAEVADLTLAYSFRYPTSTQAGRVLEWVTTREPTRYASAAPLSVRGQRELLEKCVVDSAAC